MRLEGGCEEERRAASPCERHTSVTPVASGYEGCQPSMRSDEGVYSAVEHVGWWCAS
jgi:hypothetical protein